MNDIKLSLIAAYDENMGVGIDQKLPWHIPEDLKHFREVTTGKNIIMGRSTFESLPKVLPNRTHVVFSSKGRPVSDDPAVYTVSSMKECFELLHTLNQKESVAIGGNKIWEMFLPYATDLYITKIKGKYIVDTYFPQWEEDLYKKDIIENNDRFEFIKFSK